MGTVSAAYIINRSLLSTLITARPRSSPCLWMLIASTSTLAIPGKHVTHSHGEGNSETVVRWIICEPLPSTPDKGNYQVITSLTTSCNGGYSPHKMHLESYRLGGLLCQIMCNKTLQIHLYSPTFQQQASISKPIRGSWNNKKASRQGWDVLNYTSKGKICSLYF